jgi:hypothetical protein
MADVANDGLIFHFQNMFERDDVAIAGRGDVKIGGAERVFDSRYFKTFHRGLTNLTRIGFKYDPAVHGPDKTAAQFWADYDKNRTHN